MDWDTNSVIIALIILISVIVLAVYRQWIPCQQRMVAIQTNIPDVEVFEVDSDGKMKPSVGPKKNKRGDTESELSAPVMLVQIPLSVENGNTGFDDSTRIGGGGGIMMPYGTSESFKRDMAAAVAQSDAAAGTAKHIQTHFVAGYNVLKPTEFSLNFDGSTANTWGYGQTIDRDSYTAVYCATRKQCLAVLPDGGGRGMDVGMRVSSEGHLKTVSPRAISIETAYGKCVFVSGAKLTDPFGTSRDCTLGVWNVQIYGGLDPWPGIQTPRSVVRMANELATMQTIVDNAKRDIFGVHTNESHNAIIVALCVSTMDGGPITTDMFRSAWDVAASATGCSRLKGSVSQVSGNSSCLFGYIVDSVTNKSCREMLLSKSLYGIDTLVLQQVVTFDSKQEHFVVQETDGGDGYESEDVSLDDGVYDTRYRHGQTATVSITMSEDSGSLAGSMADNVESLDTDYEDDDDEKVTVNVDSMLDEAIVPLR